MLLLSVDRLVDCFRHLRYEHDGHGRAIVGNRHLVPVTAADSRGLAKGPIQTEHDTIVAVEAYLYKGQMKSEPAFPPDQCQETANLLEEFADKLEALIRSPQQRA